MLHGGCDERPSYSGLPAVSRCVVPGGYWSAVVVVVPRRARDLTGG